MEPSPESREPVVLSQQDLDAKFKELGMLRLLNDKTVFCMVKVTHGIDEPKSKHRKPSKFDWRWERFERISDTKGFAIVKWRKHIVEDDVMLVIQFIDFEGNFYMNSDTQTGAASL